jgi:hypothetical protein
MLQLHIFCSIKEALNQSILDFCILSFANGTSLCRYSEREECYREVAFTEPRMQKRKCDFLFSTFSNCFRNRKMAVLSGCASCFAGKSGADSCLPVHGSAVNPCTTGIPDLIRGSLID